MRTTKFVRLRFKIQGDYDLGWCQLLAAKGSGIYGANIWYIRLILLDLILIMTDIEEFSEHFSDE